MDWVDPYSRYHNYFGTKQYNLIHKFPNKLFERTEKTHHWFQCGSCPWFLTLECKKNNHQSNMSLLHVDKHNCLCPSTYNTTQTLILFRVNLYILRAQKLKDVASSSDRLTTQLQIRMTDETEKPKTWALPPMFSVSLTQVIGKSYLRVQVESQWLLPSLQQTPSHTW